VSAPVIANRIYVASSWRNSAQQGVVHTLRAAKFEVYDFKHPVDGDTGFHWSDTGLNRNADDLIDAAEYQQAIQHPLAVDGYAKDYAAMQWADTFVLVLPCGRSAHLELGWAAGAGKRTVILLDDPCVPELMYRMVDHVATDVMDLLAQLGVRDEVPA